MFVRDLESADLRSEELVQCLTQLTGPKVELIEEKAVSFRATLSVLSPTEVARVFDAWKNRLSGDPVLAQGVLLWTNYGRNLPTDLLRTVIESAEPKLILRKDLRKQLRSIPNLPADLPDRLAAAMTSDEDESRRQRDEEAKLGQARQEYFRSLAEMPFERRVHAIVADKSIDPYRNWREWQGWKSEWRRCSDIEIESLSAERTQILIDLCEGNLVVRCSEVLTKLYDRRHWHRQCAIDSVRHKYSSMPPRDQLTKIVVDGSVALEHFPVELAKEVTNEWLSSLPDLPKRRFLTQISACKLRVWTKARQNLSEIPPSKNE